MLLRKRLSYKRTVSHVAVPTERMRMWSRNRNCSAKWKRD